MTQKKPLTEKQADVLEFIRGYIADHGYSPAPEKIADEFGFSNQNAGRYIDELIKRGHVSREGESRPASLVVL